MQQKSIRMMSKCSWLAIGLFTMSLSLPLSAYQQGSYLLFDIREDATESGTGGRIAVAASVFKTEAEKAKRPMDRQQSRSEFETVVDSFEGGQRSQVSGGIQILDVEDEEPGTDSTFGDDTQTGSSFGEEKPAPSGFFFTY